MGRLAVFAALLFPALVFAPVRREQPADSRLRSAARDAERNGWIEVHLQGTPAEIGYQHGYLLAEEIRDNLRAVSKELVHDEGRSWEFFRKTARDVFWPHVEQEYRDELKGMVEGLKAREVKVDVWDLVALNAWSELPYYDRWLGETAPSVTGMTEHCSAFVATGSYTRDGRVVMGHNNWSSYSSGERWNIVFNIAPAKGHRILMDGAPGLIHSGDDFAVNSAGLLMTETTISLFHGFDPAGTPEFVRSRKAMQYASTIDDFARIMRTGNSGAYANDWLVADRNTNEIASLELGLKNVTLERTRDGFFVSANFPINRKLAAEETDFDLADRSQGSNARHARWLTLMRENRGKIDVAAGERFLADHYDSYEEKDDPDERAICGHLDLSPRKVGAQPPYDASGSVQSKVADAAGAEKMSFNAAMGHACGLRFNAAEHLRLHPEFGWMREILGDMEPRPWTTFAAR